MLLYFHSSARGSMKIRAKQCTNSAAELWRAFEFKTQSFKGQAFSRTVSRVWDLSAWGAVYALVTVCLGHTGAQQGCVAAPLLLLLFPVWGSPSVCSRWELQRAWPGPQMRVGPEPWGVLQLLWLQQKGSEIIVPLWVTVKSMGCFTKWGGGEDLGSFGQEISEIQSPGMGVWVDPMAFLVALRFHHGEFLWLFLVVP